MSVQAEPVRAPARDDGIRRKVATLCLSNRVLELIVLPTEQCNFRCLYCYEDFAIGRMPAEVVAGVKALIARRAPELAQLHLSFFGGEPLIAADIVEDISTAAHVALGARYTGSVTTNGALLTIERARALREVGVRAYQISLDGVAEAHDATRRRANGAGTFAQIWANLIALRESDLDVDVVLRLHALPENIASLHALIELIRAELSDSRFSIILKPVGRWGGPNDAEFATLPEAHPALAELRRAARDFLPVREDDGAPPVCYAARSNSLVIRANGRVGKCTVALRDARNDIGAITPEGKLAIDAAKLKPWLAGVDEMDLFALACPAAAMNWKAAADAPRRAIEC
ncbi:MAG: radical SAM protein [Caulobacterales bacterium]|jgi:uncharacterized protein|nr:radical SAM protein [Caulobacterales bacterium]